MKTILVPSDFSKNALNAVKYAFAYAESTTSNITLFHSYEEPINELNLPFLNTHYGKQEAKQAAEEKMKKLVTSLNKQFPHIKTKWLVVPGSASDNILEYTAQHKTPLIIIGTTGQGAITRALIGSTTARLITNTSCTILAVPPKAKFKGIRKIAIATDLEKEGLLASRAAVTFAKQFQAGITYIYVKDLNSYDVDTTLHNMMDKIKKETKYKNISLYICNDPNIKNGLDFFIKKHKPDVFSMVTHRRKFPEIIWKTSWTNKMANHVSVPLLVLHTHKSNTVNK